MPADLAFDGIRCPHHAGNRGLWRWADLHLAAEERASQPADDKDDRRGLLLSKGRFELVLGKRM
jgi:hypothetical protein